MLDLVHVRRLFDEAMMRRPEDRSEFLDRHCAADPELRILLDRLLATADDPSALFDTTHLDTALPVHLSEHSPDTTLKEGDRLGPYELLAQIGAGAMGTVFRAHDRRLNREVAVKVVAPTYSADSTEARWFGHEARAVAALDHPNILSIHDVGMHEARPFLVTELLRGETLRERLRRGAVAEPDLVGYALQIADGLAAAHARGIVHRDLKPENLFLTTAGRVKILDFGVATMRTSDASEADRGGATPVGTVSYMAPEQVRLERIDARADVFAFGAVLYEMATGRRAFPGADRAEKLNAVLTRQPPPLTGIPCSGRLNPILERCLAKSANERYGTGKEIAEALRAAWAEAPARRRRVMPIAIGAVLVAAVVGSLALLVADERRQPAASVPDEARVIVVLPLHATRKTTPSFVAPAMTGEIGRRLSAISALRVVGRSTDETLNIDGRQRASRFGAGSVVDGSIDIDRSRFHMTIRLRDVQHMQILWSHDFERSIDELTGVETEVAEDVARALNAGLTADERQQLHVQPTTSSAAYLLYLQSLALVMFNRDADHRAIDLLRQALTLDDRFAVAESALATRLTLLGDYEDARFSDAALDAVRHALAVAPSLSEAHHVLAMVQMQKGRNADARAAFMRAINLDRTNVYSMAELSLLEVETGRYDQALLWAERGFDTQPTEAASYVQIALPLLLLGDDRASELWLREPVQRFPEYYRLQIFVALVHSLRGEDAQALAVAGAITPKNEEQQAVLAEVNYLARTPEAERLTRELASASAVLPLFNRWVATEGPLTRYAYLLAARGSRAQAALCLDRVQAAALQALRNGNESPRIPMELAAISAIQGRDTVYAWLARAYDAGWRDYRSLARDPIFDRIRNTTRFRTLMSRMEADVAAMRERANIHDTLPSGRTLPPSR
jgi:TolB-like protein